MNMRVYDSSGFGGIALPGARPSIGGYEGLQAPSYSGMSNFGWDSGGNNNYLTGYQPTFNPGVDVGSVIDNTPAGFSWFSPSTWQGALQHSGALNSVDKATGQKLDGWGGLGLSTVAGLGQAFMGMKQYGLMNDQFNFQKNAWNKEFGAQKGLINSQLEDRQKRRVSENPGYYEDVSSYMNKYGVK